VSKQELSLVLCVENVDEKVSEPSTTVHNSRAAGALSLGLISDRDGLVNFKSFIGIVDGVVVAFSSPFFEVLTVQLLRVYRVGIDHFGHFATIVRP